MKILLVNDDGIHHKNLKFLEKILEKMGHSITVVAPFQEQSAKSMAMSLHEIEYEVIDHNKYSIKGTPVDCMNFALFGLKFIPDIVISGINEGPNLGSDLMYSGTVGACVQAHKYKIPAIAISKSVELDLTSTLIEEILTFVFQKKLFSQQYVLNVNIPSINKKSEIKLCETFAFESVISGSINAGKFNFKRDIIKNTPPNSDIFEYSKKHITISKIKLEYRF